MANSTSTQRQLWAPACTRHGDLLDAYAALDACFARHGYEVGPGSGAANCRRITGGSGYSLHAYAFGPAFTWWNGRKFGVALAVDINPSKNPYGPRLVTDMPRPMIDHVTGVRTRNGKQVWVWGGYFTPNHDAMHFQVGCSPADLATGIDPATVPAGAGPAEEDDMRIITPTGGPDKDKAFLVGAHRTHIPDPRQLSGLEAIYGPMVKVSDLTWDVIKAGAPLRNTDKG